MNYACSSQGGGHVAGKECTNRIGRAKAEAQPEYLVEIERVCVHNANVHLPFLKVVRFRNFDAWRELLFCLQFVRIGTSAVVEVRLRKKRLKVYGHRDQLYTF
jgi:hypothetical protein